MQWTSSINTAIQTPMNISQIDQYFSHFQFCPTVVCISISKNILQLQRVSGFVTKNTRKECCLLTFLWYTAWPIIMYPSSKILSVFLQTHMQIFMKNWNATFSFNQNVQVNDANIGNVPLKQDSTHHFANVVRPNIWMQLGWIYWAYSMASSATELRTSWLLLWGFVKNKVYVMKHQYLPDLIHCIIQMENSEMLLISTWPLIHSAYPLVFMETFFS